MSVFAGYSLFGRLSKENAQMAKLVDALCSGRSVRKGVQVRILFWALKGLVNRRFARPFCFKNILLADVRISRPGSSLFMQPLSFNSFFPIFLFALSANSTLSITADCQENPAIIAGKDIAVVPTAYGKVRGYIHNGVYTFKGIPYATARRFMPPENPASWEDVRSSMTYGPTCPSPESDAFRDEYEFPLHRSRGYYVNENCLNLNIWSKKVNGGERKPVMVYLHGGGFSSGSSVEFPSLDGENLSRKGDVVVVSINHRLNTLGFLDLSAYGEKYRHSVNLGVMDMVSALIWVKENIANFGGDPGNVTIFGQSGGGSKVTCLLNTPSAKGLFHKAIVQSGGYLDHFIEPEVSKKVTAALFSNLGLRPDQVDSLLTIPYDRLGAAGQRAIEKVKQTENQPELYNFGLEWEPVHDGDLLPYQPVEPAAVTISGNIPLLVGSCKNEYMPFLPGLTDLSMEAANAELQKKYGDKTTAYLSAVKKAYPQTVEPADYIDIDFLFRPLVIKQADQKSKSGYAPVYVYLFAWQSPVLDGTYKAFHTMDLPFVFDNISKCEEMTGGGQKAYQLADRMSSAWIQFARTGKPNCKELPDWPAYTFINGATMILDNKCEVKYHHDKELLSIAMGQ
jgi:para-nitrobenzyl esterase